MGLRQGGASGPSAGVENTATTRWREGGGGERSREVEDAQTSDRRWLQMASPARSRLSIPHLPSVPIALLSLVVPFFLLFLCFSSLMLYSLGWCWDWDVQPAWPCCWDEAGVRTGPSVCERVCEGVCVGVCFLKETTLSPPVIISHFLFPLSPAHLRGFRGSEGQSRAQLLKVLSLGLKKSKKITLCINAKRKTWLALSSSTSTVWHVLCMAAGSLRSESFTSTKCGGWLKVRGILAEGVWGAEREEGRWGVGRGEEDSEKTVVDSNSNSVCKERKGIQPINSAGRQIQSMEVEVLQEKILRDDHYVLQILNWQ